MAIYIKKYPKLLFPITATEVTADIITYKKKIVFCSGQNSVVFLQLT